MFMEYRTHVRHLMLSWFHMEVVVLALVAR